MRKFLRNAGVGVVLAALLVAATAMAAAAAPPERETITFSDTFGLTAETYDEGSLSPNREGQS